MKRKGRPAGAPRMTTVNMAVDVANKLRTVAVHRNLTIPEAVDKYLGPVIAREFRKVVGEQSEGASPAKTEG